MFFNWNLTKKDQASGAQKRTISKPNSVVSGSSFSLPVSYYDKTTPYMFENDNEDNEFDDDIKGFDDFGEEFEGVEGMTNEDDSNESGEFKDIVQAFNPYVKVSELNFCRLKKF